MAAVGHRTVASFAIRTPRPTTERAAPGTDIVEILTLTVELDAKADVPVPQVALVGRCLVHTHPTANVELPMVASSATPPAPFTQGPAVPPTDGVVAPLHTVGLDAKADVMAQPVVLGATLGPPLQLQRRLEPKSPYWARLRVRLRLAVILLMVPVALGMGILFVVIGQTVLVVLFTG